MKTKLLRFEYVLPFNYTLEKVLSSVKYKTVDNMYFDSDEAASNHVAKLISDRKRLNALIKANVLNNLELNTLFKNINTLKKEPKELSVIKSEETYRYKLYVDDDIEDYVIEFNYYDDVIDYLQDEHNVRWNLKLIEEEVK